MVPLTVIILSFWLKLDLYMCVCACLLQRQERFSGCAARDAGGVTVGGLWCWWLISGDMSLKLAGCCSHFFILLTLHFSFTSFCIFHKSVNSWLRIALEHEGTKPAIHLYSEYICICEIISNDCMWVLVYIMFPQDTRICTSMNGAERRTICHVIIPRNQPIEISSCVRNNSNSEQESFFFKKVKLTLKWGRKTHNKFVIKRIKRRVKEIVT